MVENLGKDGRFSENIKESLQKKLGELTEETKKDYIDAAETAIKEKHISEAEIVLQELKSKYADDPHVLYNLGVLNLCQENICEAKSYIQKAVESGYVTKKSVYSLSLIEQGLGNKAEALRWLKQAAEIDDSDVAVSTLLLVELFNQHRYEQAVAQARQMQEKFPESYALAQMELSALFHMNEQTRINKRLEELEDRFATEPLFIYDKAKVHVNHGRYQEALAYLAENVKHLDPDARAYNELHAKIYAKLQMNEELISVLTVLFKQHHSSKAALSLAMLFMQREKNAEADQILLRVISSSQRDYHYCTALMLHASCVKAMAEDREKVEKAYIYALKEFNGLYKDPKCGFLALQFSAECFKELGMVQQEKICRDYIEEIRAKVQQHKN